MLRIITIDQRSLEQHCVDLARQVTESGYRPDVIVAIASAGVVITAIMKRSECFDEADYCAVMCNRSFKGLKTKFSWIVRSMPKAITNLLRNAEHAIRLRSATLDGGRKVDFVDDAVLLIRTAEKILVIDDAIDSGGTADAVVCALRRVNPNAETRIGVIAVTTEMPKVFPTYCIYRSVLVRFPWSADAI